MEKASSEALPEPEASPGIHSRAVTWPVILLFLLAAAPICFLGLGATDVVTMEGIVADGARHMDRTHEYSVPHMHGEIFSYKPPLAYWLALASFRLFGEETEWTLRFPFALSGLLMGLAVLVLTSRVAGPKTGLLCAFASLTGALTIQKLHLAESEMPLAAGVGIATAVACRCLTDHRPRVGLWLIGYLALALAFLAKGVPAVMFYAPGLLLATWLTRRHKELLRPAHLAGVMLFVVVVSWWLVSAYQAAGWAAFEQPLAEAHDKGLTWNLSLLGLTLAKPLLAGVLFLPWSLLLPASFRSEKWSVEPVRRMALAAAAFVAAGVATFMIVPAGESRYLLPLTAPMGILCGLAAREVLGSGGDFRRRAIEVLTLLVALGVVAAALFTTSADAASRWLLLSLAVVTLALTVRGFFRRAAFSGIRLLVAVAVLGWLVHTRGVEPHRAGSRSLRAMAASFETHLDPGSELWTGPVDKNFRHSSLFFYLRRPVRTLAAESGSGPRAGDYVVFFSDEHEELMTRTAFDYEIVERGQQRKEEFILARVRGIVQR